jgi:hypothetical protein
VFCSLAHLQPGKTASLFRSQFQARCEAQLSVVIEDGTSQAVTYMDGSLVWKLLRPTPAVLQKMERWSVQCQGLQYWHDDMAAEPITQVPPNVLIGHQNSPSLSSKKKPPTLFEKKTMYETWIRELACLATQRKFVFVCEPLDSSSNKSAKMRSMSIKMNEMEVASHTLDQQKMKVLEFFEQDSTATARHCIQMLQDIS